VAGRVDAGEIAARGIFRVAGVCGAVCGAEVAELAGGEGGAVGEDGAVGCEDAGLVSWGLGDGRGTYIMVVISGGERLSSKRSLSASASSILISGRPGIMVSVVCPKGVQST
jgi:hypothetical protein